MAKTIEDTEAKRYLGLTVYEWNQHFVTQAELSQKLRKLIYRKFSSEDVSAILDIGCGTGTITAELQEQYDAEVTGIDNNPAMIKKAKELYPDVTFRAANVSHLPFDPDSFDLITGHFSMLWLRDPSAALKEIHKVLKPEGHYLILGEPDYGGGVHYPSSVPFWRMYSSALEKIGANPFIGRELRSLLIKNEFKPDIRVIAKLYTEKELREGLEQEWRMIERSSIMATNTFEKMIETHYKAIQSGKCTSLLPIFYGSGKKI